MTPKEKAEELVRKYWHSKGIDIEKSIECALIAVDYIITSNPHSNPINTEVYSTMSYWIEVKREIEKL